MEISIATKARIALIILNHPTNFNIFVTALLHTKIPRTKRDDSIVTLYF